MRVRPPEGRKIVGVKRVARFRNRFRSLTWDGRRANGRRVANGVYYVRFRIRDAENRLDSRRVVVERKRGRFAKRGRFYLSSTAAPRELTDTPRARCSAGARRSAAL